MMMKRFRSIVLTVGIAVAPLCLSPVMLHAQQQNHDQQAYQAGYANGETAARENRPMNMNTDDWHGDRLTAYQQGYQEGYRSVTGRDHDRDRDYSNGRYAQDQESQRAFQAGYQNGLRDAQRNHSMNMRTDDWHGERLQAYHEGYREGYRSVDANHREHHHDDDDAR